MSDKAQDKKSAWDIVNLLVAAILFITIIPLLVTLKQVYFLNILLNFLLVLFYRKQRENGKFKKTVIILRIVAVVSFLFMYSGLVLLVGCKYFKPAYRLKKNYYCRQFTDYEKYLPEKLPECYDYKFVTQLAVPAQDYHPSAYLIFHTDSETMHRLESEYSSLENAKPAEIQPAEEYDYIPAYPPEFPGYVYGMLDDIHIDDFFDAIIYKIPSYYDKGCIFDYSSGLVVYWT